jgi:hypothetical protein
MAQLFSIPASNESPRRSGAVFTAWKALRGGPAYQQSLLALRRAGQQLSIEAARRGELRDLASWRALVVLRASTIVQRLPL